MGLVVAPHTNNRTEAAQAVETKPAVDINLASYETHSALCRLSEIKQQLEQRRENLENSQIFGTYLTEQMQALLAMQASTLSYQAEVSNNARVANERALLEIIESRKRNSNKERDYFSPTERLILCHLICNNRANEADQQLLKSVSKCMEGLDLASSQKLVAEISKAVETTLASLGQSEASSELSKQLFDDIKAALTQTATENELSATVEQIDTLAQELADSMLAARVLPTVASELREIGENVAGSAGINNEQLDRLAQSFTGLFNEIAPELNRNDYQTLLNNIQAEITEKPEQDLEITVTRNIQAMLAVNLIVDQQADLIGNKLQPVVQAIFNPNSLGSITTEDNLNNPLLSFKVQTVAQAEQLVVLATQLAHTLEQQNNEASLQASLYLQKQFQLDLLRDNPELAKQGLTVDSLRASGEQEFEKLEDEREAHLQIAQLDINSIIGAERYDSSVLQIDQSEKINQVADILLQELNKVNPNLQIARQEITKLSAAELLQLEIAVSHKQPLASFDEFLQKLGGDDLEEYVSTLRNNLDPAIAAQHLINWAIVDGVKSKELAATLSVLDQDMASKALGLLSAKDPNLLNNWLAQNDLVQLQGLPATELVTQLKILNVDNSLETVKEYLSPVENQLAKLENNLNTADVNDNIAYLQQLQVKHGQDYVDNLVNAYYEKHQTSLSYTMLNKTGSDSQHRQATLEKISDPATNLLAKAERERLAKFLVGEKALEIADFKSEIEQLEKREKQNDEFIQICRDFALANLNIDPNTVINDPDKAKEQIAVAVAKQIPELAGLSWSELSDHLRQIVAANEQDDYSNLPPKLSQYLFDQSKIDQLKNFTKSAVTADTHGNTIQKLELQQQEIKLRLAECKSIIQNESSELLDNVNTNLSINAESQLATAINSSQIYLNSFEERIRSATDDKQKAEIIIERDRVEWQITKTRVDRLLKDEKPDVAQAKQLLVQFSIPIGKEPRSKEFQKIANNLLDGLKQIERLDQQITTNSDKKAKELISAIDILSKANQKVQEIKTTTAELQAHEENKPRLSWWQVGPLSWNTKSHKEQSVKDQEFEKKKHELTNKLTNLTTELKKLEPELQARGKLDFALTDPVTQSEQLTALQDKYEAEVTAYHNLGQRSLYQEQLNTWTANLLSGNPEKLEREKQTVLTESREHLKQLSEKLEELKKSEDIICKKMGITDPADARKHIQNIKISGVPNIGVSDLLSKNYNSLATEHEKIVAELHELTAVTIDRFNLNQHKKGDADYFRSVIPALQDSLNLVENETKNTATWQNLSDLSTKIQHHHENSELSLAYYTTSALIVEQDPSIATNKLFEDFTQILETGTTTDNQTKNLATLKAIISADSPIGIALSKVDQNLPLADQLDHLAKGLEATDNLHVQLFLHCADKPQVASKILGIQSVINDSPENIWQSISQQTVNSEEELQAISTKISLAATLSNIEQVKTWQANTDTESWQQFNQRVSSATGKSPTQILIDNLPLNSISRYHALVSMADSNLATDQELAPFFPNQSVPARAEREQVLYDMHQNLPQITVPENIKEYSNEEQIHERAILIKAVQIYSATGQIDKLKDAQQQLQQIDNGYKEKLDQWLATLPTEQVNALGLKQIYTQQLDYNTAQHTVDQLGLDSRIGTIAHKLAGVVSKAIPQELALDYIRREKLDPKDSQLLELLYLEHCSFKPELKLSGKLATDLKYLPTENPSGFTKLDDALEQLLRGGEQALSEYDLIMLTEGIRTHNSQMTSRAMLSIAAYNTAQDIGATIDDAVSRLGENGKQIWENFKETKAYALVGECKDAIVYNDTARKAILELKSRVGSIQQCTAEFIQDYKNLLSTYGAEAVRKLGINDLMQEIKENVPDVSKAIDYMTNNQLVEASVEFAKRGITASGDLVMPYWEMALDMLPSEEQKKQFFDLLDEQIKKIPNSFKYVDGKEPYVIQYIKAQKDPQKEAHALFLERVFVTKDFSEKDIKTYFKLHERLAAQQSTLNDFFNTRSGIRAEAEALFTNVANKESAAIRDYDTRILNLEQAKDVVHTNADFKVQQKNLIDPQYYGLKDIEITKSVIQARSRVILMDFLQNTNSGLNADHNQRDFVELVERDTKIEWKVVDEKGFTKWIKDSEQVQKALSQADFIVEVGTGVGAVGAAVLASWIPGVNAWVGGLAGATLWNLGNKAIAVGTGRISEEEGLRKFLIEGAWDVATLGVLKAGQAVLKPTFNLAARAGQQSSGQFLTQSNTAVRSWIWNPIKNGVGHADDLKKTLEVLDPKSAQAIANKALLEAIEEVPEAIGKQVQLIWKEAADKIVAGATRESVERAAQEQIAKLVASQWGEQVSKYAFRNIVEATGGLSTAALAALALQQSKDTPTNEKEQENQAKSDTRFGTNPRIQSNQIVNNENILNADDLIVQLPHQTLVAASPEPIVADNIQYTNSNNDTEIHTTTTQQTFNATLDQQNPDNITRAPSINDTTLQQEPQLVDIQPQDSTQLIPIENDTFMPPSNSQIESVASHIDSNQTSVTPETISSPVIDNTEAVIRPTNNNTASVEGAESKNGFSPDFGPSNEPFDNPFTGLPSSSVSTTTSSSKSDGSGDTPPAYGPDGFNFAESNRQNDDRDSKTEYRPSPTLADKKVDDLIDVVVTKENISNKSRNTEQEANIFALPNQQQNVIPVQQQFANQQDQKQGNSNLNIQGLQSGQQIAFADSRQENSYTIAVGAAARNAEKQLDVNANLLSSTTPNQTANQSAYQASNQVTQANNVSEQNSLAASSIQKNGYGATMAVENGNQTTYVNTNSYYSQNSSKTNTQTVTMALNEADAKLANARTQAEQDSYRQAGLKEAAINQSLSSEVSTNQGENKLFASIQNTQQVASENTQQQSSSIFKSRSYSATLAQDNVGNSKVAALANSHSIHVMNQERDLTAVMQELKEALASEQKLSAKQINKQLELIAAHAILTENQQQLLAAIMRGQISDRKQVQKILAEIEASQLDTEQLESAADLAALNAAQAALVIDEQKNRQRRLINGKLQPMNEFGELLDEDDDLEQTDLDANAIAIAQAIEIDPELLANQELAGDDSGDNSKKLRNLKRKFQLSTEQQLALLRRLMFAHLQQLMAASNRKTLLLELLDYYGLAIDPQFLDQLDIDRILAEEFAEDLENADLEQAQANTRKMLAQEAKVAAQVEVTKTTNSSVGSGTTSPKKVKTRADLYRELKS